ncbi:MAG: hypothetical protein J0H60_02670, partial [Rhizobiales bacterium]|nr:hypothetical protein [Hyphomicrobiales bacterium]
GFAVAQYDAVGMVLAAATKGATTPDAVTKYLASNSYKGLAMTYKSDGKGNMAHSSVIICYGNNADRVPKIAKRYDDGIPVTVFISPEGVNAPIEGLFGGQPGLLAHGYVLDDQGAVVEDVGTGGLVMITSADRLVELQLGGGAGYGDPLKRAVDDVEYDMREGYVSAEAAESIYGLTDRKKEKAA